MSNRLLCEKMGVKPLKGDAHKTEYGFCISIGKVHPRTGTEALYRPYGRSRGIALPLTVALEGGEGSASHPGHSLPPGKTQYPFYRRLGGPQGRSGQVWKIAPPHRNSIPGPSGPYPVAIPTTLPGPQLWYSGHFNIHLFNPLYSVCMRMCSCVC